MKTGKTALLTIVAALALYLLVGLCFVPRYKQQVAVEDAGADNAPVAANGIYLANEQDSMAYAVSMMIAGDMPLAMKEMGVTSETLDYFVKGLCDAFPADESPEALAYAHGVVVGASAMEMLDEANRAIYQSDTAQCVDARIFLEGLKAIATSNKSVMSIDDACDYYYGRVFRKPSEEFIAKNSTRSGVQTLPGGVQLKIEREGKGETPAPESKVGYIYKASFINGKLAESSRGEVVEAVVATMLPGLYDAFTSLPVGTKCKLYLPWQKAYGAMGSNKVPPYSALVYDIEIVKIIKE